MKAQPHPSSITDTEEASGVIATPARVVYTQAPVQLGRMVSLHGSEGVVRVGESELECHIDPTVDPALIAEAIESGARVLLESGTPPLVVGVIATQRSLNIDREGRVDAELTSFSMQVKEEVLMRTREAFLRVRGREVETFAGEVLTRARDTVRLLGALIRMN